jgi:hypothetical protein
MALGNLMSFPNERVFKKGAYVFFILLFVVGCFVFSDYGISTDEEVQRGLIGEINYNFIKTGNSAELLEDSGKYHGPAFELVLYAAERVFNITEVRNIYLLRHALTFLIFFISSIFFYFLCLKIFKHHAAALFGVVVLVVSPRIFAESFYNSKDLPMLCFCIISTYTMFLFVERQTIWLALIHAACCGFTFDIRIMGLLIPIATIYLFMFQKKKKLLPILSFLFYTIIFCIAFWPVLWLNPLFHFVEAFKQMSKYPGVGNVLYMGNFISEQALPWHYLPVWIGITTPICYIVLFFIGLFFTIKNTFVNFKSTLPMQVFLFMFASPILAVIVLHSVVYDAWRHVYFVYPFLVLIAVYGFMQLIQAIKNTIALKAIFCTVAVSIVFVLFFMVKNHPFQNVYFNPLAGKDIRKNYELDYWGLSYRQGLEYIVAHDKSPQIYIGLAHIDLDMTCYLNFRILPKAEFSRLFFTTNFQSANYFLTNFRWHPDDYNIGTSVYQIKVGDEKIMEVLKLK